MLKSDGSIGEFITIEKSREFVRTGEELSTENAAARIKDIIRFTAEYPSETYTENYQQTSDALTESGWKLIDISNKWIDDENYHGFNTYWRDAQGTLVELQFHTEEGVYTKEMYSHPIYEQARLILPQGIQAIDEYGDPIYDANDKPVFESTSQEQQLQYKGWDLYNQLVDIWDRIEVPPDVDTVKSWKDMTDPANQKRG